MMEPEKLALLREFAPLIGGLGLICTFGWIFTTWLRVRHGYPLVNEWSGKPLYPLKAPETDRMISALGEENRALRTELGELKNRVAVLERIATDPAARLDREIAALNQASLN